VSAPAGASIHPATGVFTWTPTEAQGPEHQRDRGAGDGQRLARIDATNNFTVVVNQVNSAPVLPVIADKTIKELNTLSFAVSATGLGRSGEHAHLQFARNGAGGGQHQSGDRRLHVDADGRARAEHEHVHSERSWTMACRR
jgi:hypothetical protein